MASPSYELVAEQDAETYQVTVHPKYGKPVTLYVRKSGEHWRRGARFSQSYGRRTLTMKAETGQWWHVKAGPNTSGYITRHRTKEEAEVGANKRARQYGRRCSRPIRRA